MKKLIIIKYGELNTKKGNIDYFIQTLKRNIQSKLSNYEVEVNSNKARMYITVDSDKYEEVISILKKIFGIHEIITGYELDSREFNDITKE